MPSHFSPRLFKRGGGAAFLWLAVVSAPSVHAQTPAPGKFNLYVPSTPAPAASASPTPEDKRFSPPKELKRGPVTYPILANLNRIEGVVGVRFAIDEAGKVKDATAYRTSGSFLLDAVVKSRGIMEWTFQPATFDGKPVPSTYEKEIEFHLDPAEQREFARKRLAAPVGTPDPPYPAEALAMQPRPKGDCTIGVYWLPSGLVDNINLLKSSGSATLDHAALRFAYENWHIDPSQIKDPKVQFTKVLSFVPPAGAAGAAATPKDDSGTPPPLSAGSPTPKPKRTH